MGIIIRDWEENFERDRTKQWKNIQWVPIPNKQGKGYRRIMDLKNGTEIFGVWIALVQVASKEKIRGDLSGFSINDLSLMTLIKNIKLIEETIRYLSETLDWIIVTENIDSQVNKIDNCGISKPVDSSVLFNSVQYSSIQFSYAFESQEFKNAYDEWMKYRKERKKALVETTIKKQMIKLAKMGEQRAIAAIEYSIEKGYEGIYEEPQYNNKKQVQYGRQELTKEQIQESLNWRPQDE